MADNQGSARVTLREIDLSQVRDPEVLPQGVPAAVVGPAKRGPAFVPKTFANVQQFGEIFGSLSEISQDSNANRFGPLAINEWMRNAEAGAYVRVLGVGDGDGTLGSDNKTEGAGFVVGDSVSYNGTDLSHNAFANLEATHEEAARAVARTHFLGCFMKDAAGSTFLQDAGIQLDDARATLTIDFDPDNSGTGLPTQGSTITLTGGAVTITYTFANNDNGTNIDVTTHNTPAALASEFADRVNAQAQISASVVQVNGVNTAKVLITQDAVGEAGNTPVTLNLSAASREVIKIESGSTSIFNSTTGEQIRMDGGGATQASITLSIHDLASPVNAANNNTLKLKALKDDRTLTAEVTITLQDDSTFNVNDDSVFKAGNATSMFVRIGENALDTLEGQKETLRNIAAAINDTETQATELEGLLTASLSTDGQTLTITQKNKGKLDGLNGDLDAIAKFTMPAGSFELQGTEGSAAEQIEAFTGGTNGNGTITFTFSDQPRVNDNFTLISTSGATNTFKFIANNNGNSNGKVHSDTTSVNIELGSTLAGTMEFIKSAIESAEAIVNVDDVLTVTNTSSTVTIVQDTSGPSGDTLVTFNMSDKVTASTASSSLVGNFGQKTTSFAGGGGSAAPVIRGLLMTPQGVKATLDVSDSASYTGTNVSGFDEVEHLRKSVTSGGTVRSFGSNESADLIGYEIGKVSSNSFTLLLNGFSNADQPAILTCSFDPESVNYFAKVLNTDPEKIEECGHYLHAHWDIDPAVATVSLTGLFTAGGAAASSETAAFCLPSRGNRNEAVATKPNFEGFETRFRTAKSPWIMSQKFGGQTKKLFRLHAQDDGAVANNRFRVLLSDLRLGKTASDWATFTLSLESFDSDPVSGEVIASWKSLTLDPDSRNFIGRVLGNRRLSYSFKKNKLVEEGDFELRNKYVWVELADDVMAGEVDLTTLPCGFSGLRTLNTGFNGLFDEAGTNGSGGSRLLQAASLDQLKVLPLPYVKTITRESGASQTASADLAWGVKFAKKRSAGLHKELGEIRINPSIKSWTKFLPDMGLNDNERFTVESTEDFSLENIALTTGSTNWSTSEYVRSGLSEDLPTGKSYLVLNDVASGSNVKYLKFRCIMQGGFDGLNIFNKEKAALSSIAAHREAQDETGDSSFTGPTIVSYQKAIDVLTDKSATEIQLLAIPGMREPLVTDYAITACESRFDAMLVMDVEESDSGGEVIVSSDAKPHVGQTITKFENRSLDTSFAAAYFPDVISRRSSNNTPIQVPPSVCMLGVMSQNDTLADPWFAPAGLTRGRLNASSAKVQMSRDLLNDLYDADINPIYVPAGRSNEVYAFGQKTLMQNQSALDRINVRRLLINIRRRVKAVANTLLFEPNRASTLARFSALVEPIMAEVQARQGVERYKVQIDTSTTTQNDVENNTIRGKVYLQPTKSVEFISLDFVVTNSID
jgi:hypothetical protein